MLKKTCPRVDDVDETTERGPDTTFEDEWTKLQKENKVQMTLDDDLQ